MGRVLLAFRSFFAILFHGALPDEVVTELGLAPAASPPPAAQPAPAVRVSDGALQILSILQRDSRLIDFMMEDVSGYSDEQVGAAVRGLHDQCRESLNRYITLQPVIDGVEGTFTKPAISEPAALKFVGNVPAGTPIGGVLRHKGWRVSRLDLPPLSPQQDSSIIAPAEIEIE